MSIAQDVHLPTCQSLRTHFFFQFQLLLNNSIEAVIIDPDINVDIESIRKKREIIIQSHGGALLNIPSDSPLYDPLSYTILFPNGDLGWTFTLRTNNNKKITLLRYYSNRLHFRDKYGPIYYDIVLHAGLLSHQYIIDCWIKTEENRKSLLKSRCCCAFNATL